MTAARKAMPEKDIIEESQATLNGDLPGKINTVPLSDRMFNAVSAREHYERILWPDEQAQNESIWPDNTCDNVFDRGGWLTRKEFVDNLRLAGAMRRFDILLSQDEEGRFPYIHNDPSYGINSPRNDDLYVLTRVLDRFDCNADRMFQNVSKLARYVGTEYFSDIGEAACYNTSPRKAALIFRQGIADERRLGVEGYIRSPTIRGSLAAQMKETMIHPLLRGVTVGKSVAEEMMHWLIVEKVGLPEEIGMFDHWEYANTSAMREGVPTRDAISLSLLAEKRGLVTFTPSFLNRRLKTVKGELQETIGEVIVLNTNPLSTIKSTINVKDLDLPDYATLREKKVALCGKYTWGRRGSKKWERRKEYAEEYADWHFMEWGISESPLYQRLVHTPISVETSPHAAESRAPQEISVLLFVKNYMKWQSQPSPEEANRPKFEVGVDERFESLALRDERILAREFNQKVDWDSMGITIGKRNPQDNHKDIGLLYITGRLARSEEDVSKFVFSEHVPVFENSAEVVQMLNGWRDTTPIEPPSTRGGDYLRYKRERALYWENLARQREYRELLAYTAYGVLYAGFRHLPPQERLQQQCEVAKFMVETRAEMIPHHAGALHYLEEDEKIPGNVRDALLHQYKLQQAMDVAESAEITDRPAPAMDQGQSAGM